MRAILTIRICSVLVACAILAVSVRTACAQPFAIPPNRPKHSAWIPLNYQYQEFNLCSPTSAAIILDYFDDYISARKIKALTLNKPYEPGDKFTDFTPTPNRDLIAGLARVGFDWYEKGYANNSRGLKLALDDVERSLDARIPVMISTTLYGGHVFVAAGYSVADKEIFVVDPGVREGGIRTVGYRELDSIWNSPGTNHRFAVYPRRRTAQPHP